MKVCFGKIATSVCFAVAAFRLLAADPVTGYVYTPGDKGYVDTHLRIDTASFTVEAWVYATAKPTDNMIFSQYSSGTSVPFDFAFRLRGGEGNKPGVFWRGAAPDGGNLSLLGTAAVQLNAWTHVAAVCDGESHTLTIYVNGTAAGSCSVKEGAIPVQEDILRIGGWNSALSYGFGGFLMEARLWSVARSATEIGETKDVPLTEPQAGLVGCWPLSRARGGVAVNRAGGADGVMRDGSFVFRSGLPLPVSEDYSIGGGRVALLDETSTPFVTDMRPGLSVFSVEAWVCPRFTDVENCVVCEYAGNGGAGDFAFSVKNGKAFVWWRNYGGELLSSQPVPAGVWSHIAMTSDGDELKVYVNGKFGGLLKRTAADPVRMNANVPIVVGGRDSGVPFCGMISDVRFWSRTLTAEEIAGRMRVRLKGDEEGLAGYWPLNEESGDVALNRCVNGGTDAIGANVIRICDDLAPLAKVKYPFSNEWAYRSDSAGGSLNTGFLLGEAFTVEGWINPDDAGSAENVIAGAYVGGSNNDIVFKTQNGKVIGWYRNFGQAESAAGAAVPNKWMHVALTCDGDELTVYVNGNAGVSVRRTASSRLTPVAQNLFLAAHSASGSPFRGLMREMRYWNRARTASEIAKEWRYVLKKAQPGLVGYWPMDAADPLVVRSLGTEYLVLPRTGIWVKSPLDLRQHTTGLMIMIGFDPKVQTDDPPGGVSEDTPFVATCVKDLELEPMTVDSSPDVARYGFDKLNFAMNGGMAQTRGGRLYALWTAGGDSDAAFLVGSYSDDGGNTWQGTKFVIDPHLPGDKWNGQTVRRCSLIGNLWSAPDGTLRLYASQSVGQFSGRGSCWEFVCSNPDDARPVWSKAKYIFYGSMHNKPIVTQDGTWLAPFDFEPWGHENFPELDPQRGLWAFATADGKSWAGRGKVTPNLSHYAEHQFLQKDNGDLWMLMRTGDGLKESISSDGGVTWSTPADPVVLRQCIARFSFIRLASGNLLFVKNGTTVGEVIASTPRQKLSAFLSYDGGTSWSGPLVLDSRVNVAYPDAFQGKDGFIYVSYDHDRDTSGGDQLLFARFTEADILAKGIVTDGSFLQRVIFSEES